MLEKVIHQRPGLDWVRDQQLYHSTTIFRASETRYPRQADTGRFNLHNH